MRVGNLIRDGCFISSFRCVQGNRILRSYILVERALIEGILCHIAGHDLVDLQCAGCLIKGAVLKLNLNGCLELIRGIGPSAVHDNALQRFYLIGANNKIIKSDPFECHCFDPIRTSFDIFTLIVFFIIRARLVFIVGVGDMLGICFVVFILGIVVGAVRLGFNEVAYCKDFWILHLVHGHRRRWQEGHQQAKR